MRGFFLLLMLCITTCSHCQAQRNRIVKIKIPAQYKSLNNEEIIKRLLIRPMINGAEYVYAADTLVKALDVCGFSGVYQYGRGKSDHRVANYRVVNKIGNELQYVQSAKSQSGHRRLLHIYYRKTLGDKCSTSSDSKLLKTQVARLVEINSRESFNNLF